MGLQIAAYEIVRIRRGRDRIIGGDKNEIYLYKSVVKVADGMVDGVYLFSGKTIEFPVGSAHHFAEWREQLSGLRLTDHKAFKELLTMSDCDGFIGPKTSAKLAADFAAFLKLAVIYARRLNANKRGSGNDFRQIFADFYEAFKMASQNGVVVFM